jgi:putative thioredoxin
MSDLQNIFDVTSDTFSAQVIERSHALPVLVDYWADWCGPCRMQMPVLQQLVEEYAGRFVIAKVNTDEQHQLAVQQNIRSLPTMRIYRHGKIVEEISGAQTESTLRTLLDRHIERASDRVRAEARALFEAGNQEEALARLSACHADEPDNQLLTLEFARLSILAGRHDQAGALLDALPHEVRNESAALAVRAMLEFARTAGNAPDLTALQQRVEQTPDDSETRYRLGAALLLAGHTRAALDQFMYLLQHDRTFREDAGRKALLAAFELLGKDDELAVEYRRRMAAALY